MRSSGRCQIDEIDSLGGATEFFLDDRPAAPCERIGHYQWPCTHSPALHSDPSAVLGFSLILPTRSTFPGRNISSHRGISAHARPRGLFGTPALCTDLQLPLAVDHRQHGPRLCGEVDPIWRPASECDVSGGDRCADSPTTNDTMHSGSPTSC